MNNNKKIPNKLIYINSKIISKNKIIFQKILITNRKLKENRIYLFFHVK